MGMVCAVPHPRARRVPARSRSLHRLSPPGEHPKGFRMAGTKRPSFLKSQKEQKRKAKAQEKREARQNKRARAAEAARPEPEAAVGAAEPHADPGPGDEAT